MRAGIGSLERNPPTFRQEHGSLHATGFAQYLVPFVFFAKVCFATYEYVGIVGSSSFQSELRLDLTVSPFPSD
jgi:hypothetical protein